MQRGLLLIRDAVLNVRALDSEDAGVVSEYAYALKGAFAEKFSVELCDARTKGYSPLLDNPGQQTAFATLSLSSI